MSFSANQALRILNDSVNLGMAKEQNDDARQKQIEINRKESADEARKQLRIPKKNREEATPPPPRDNSGN